MVADTPSFQNETTPMSEGEGTSSADDAVATCAVCLETVEALGVCARAVMPCCERTGATMAFCLRCVQIICQQG
jgi:hypothetical protein